GGGVHRGLHLVEVADVGAVEERADLLRERGTGLLVGVGDQHPSPAGGGAARGGRADSARASGDQDALSVERAHAFSPLGYGGAGQNTRLARGRDRMRCAAPQVSGSASAAMAPNLAMAGASHPERAYPIPTSTSACRK